ncbi:MAG: argininosuccinate lyase, partial [Ilumatobacteraceae bacterium]
GATDLAEHLVRAGRPFREAHAVVGALVRRSLAGEGALVDLVRAAPELGDEAAALLAPGVGVSLRSSRGGAGSRPVAEQRARLDAAVARWEGRLS